MDAQLAQIGTELEEASGAMRGLVAGLPAGAWDKRPVGGGWSVAHCVMHLNTTAEEFLPQLDAAIREGREKNLTGKGPFRRDFAGWLLCKLVEPPYRLKVKTPPRFDPQVVDLSEKVMAEWERLQGELRDRVYAADGLALNKLQVISPFSARMKYHLWSAFVVIPAHQRRHIWQAQQIVKQLQASG
jgi:hypothetical protein